MIVGYTRCSIKLVEEVLLKRVHSGISIHDESGEIPVGLQQNLIRLIRDRVLNLLNCKYKYTQRSGSGAEWM